MNTPNKLTILRILLVIPLAFFLLIPFPFRFLAAMLLFIIASITDMVDGMMARRKNLITNLGKFLDPLADKILICTVLICFINLDLISAAAVIIIIAREFAVTALRLIAAEKGVVLAAAFWGKLKTILQISAIIGIFAFNSFSELFPELKIADLYILCDILVWLAVALTIVSGIEYFINNRRLILDSEQ